MWEVTGSSFFASSGTQGHHRCQAEASPPRRWLRCVDATHHLIPNGFAPIGCREFFSQGHAHHKQLLSRSLPAHLKGKECTFCRYVSTSRYSKPSITHYTRFHFLFHYPHITPNYPTHVCLSLGGRPSMQCPWFGTSSHSLERRWQSWQTRVHMLCHNPELMVLKEKIATMIEDEKNI